MKPVLVQAQTFGPTPPGTTIIPAISVSERYDTNVWLAPPQLLPPGTRLNDFATTLQGSLKLLHKDKNVEASLLGGLDGNVFVHNSGLNYLSTRVDAYADLSGWADHFARGAQLRVYDYFRYTPTSPGFLQGGKAGTEDPFLRGIQSFRANTFSNTANAEGVYPVYRGLGVQGKYAFSLYRIGSILAATDTGATFFNTTVHTWSVGPRLELAHRDSIALLYQQSLINQETTSGTSAPFNTNTQSLTANYTRVMTNWTFGVGGGVTLVEPASQAFPTGNIRISTNPERSTVVQLDLSRQAAPSFFLTAGALISNVAQLQIIHRLEKHLTLRASANYGFNQSIPKDADTQFTNITLSAGLNYRVTKSVSIDLYYDHNDFKTESPSINYVVLRDVVGLALTAEWR